MYLYIGSMDYSCYNKDMDKMLSQTTWLSFHKAKKNNPRANEGLTKKLIMNSLSCYFLDINSHKNLDALILASINNHCQGVCRKIPIFPMSADVNIKFTSVFFIAINSH